MSFCTTLHGYFYILLYMGLQFAFFEYKSAYFFYFFIFIYFSLQCCRRLTLVGYFIKNYLYSESI